MKRIFRIWFLALSMLMVLGAKARVVNDSVRIAGYLRHFTMYLPDGISANAPLVFVIHGYGGNASAHTWMNDAADKHGFAVCAPAGLKDPKNRRSWNVGYPFQAGWKVDDVKALCQMAKYVQAKYSLSKENTFLTGMSNGGEMCYLLTYSKQTTFKAFGSLAGLTLDWMYQDLSIPRAIPFLEIHGTQDHTSEWFGDLENKGGWGAYVPVPIAVGRVVAKNRCTRMLTDTIAGLTPKNKRYIIRHKYLNEKSHNDVWLYEVVGAPHCTFGDDLHTGEVVWEFFKQYVR